MSLPELWEILGSEIWLLRAMHGALIHGLVLLPDHFHFMMTAPEAELGILMRQYLAAVTRRHNRRMGRTGFMFNSPYTWSLIRDARYFGHALKYLYRHPVRHHLSGSVETYAFSTMHGLSGQGQLPFPIDLSRLGFESELPLNNNQALLEWLNEPFPEEAEPLIRRGLRRRYFDELKSPRTRLSYPVLASRI